jgi:hypothetical protein
MYHVKLRPPIAVILLGWITLGFYYFYWYLQGERRGRDPFGGRKRETGTLASSRFAGLVSHHSAVLSRSPGPCWSGHA